MRNRITLKVPLPANHLRKKFVPYLSIVGIGRKRNYDWGTVHSNIKLIKKRVKENSKSGRASVLFEHKSITGRAIMCLM